jgi:hypothetical protein
MRQIKPYQTAWGAKRALDNGGRFYNLWTQADDNVVDAGELAKAAGVHSSDVKAFLHFEMALMDLPEQQQAEVRSLLSPGLKKRLRKWQPRVLNPSRVESEGAAGVPAIVTGYPSFVEDRTQLQAFIVLITPVITLIPIVDMFDVYEVYDTPERMEPRTVIATVRGSERLDSVYSRFGGVLKELQFEDKTGKDHGLYLEATYYTPLQ